MIQDYKIENILFLDIETVPAFENYDKQDERLKILWDKKALRLKTDEDESAKDLYPRAGIYAEFGKIICISVSFFHKGQLRVKSYYGHDEKQLLIEFKDLLNQYFNTPYHLLCGHNAKEFDFPYIARRMLVNRIVLPSILDLAGKKPWEVGHLDTMHLWKFGDFKNYTSLEVLATLFDIPTPKDDIDGSDVWKVYWQDKDLERIKTYCEKDTITVVRLFQAFRCEEPIAEDLIFYSE